ncbi:uncharacterized protein DUF4270 [Flavobacterium sp. 9]|uniref:DUF4270 domain-containing protein n=1 Tax=Flavobacterium sp. 9 TaxID=2035198 RepID=UPI000C19A38A|nr:DUF4270 domain-containing protein [Flavobacterium sp. 9]PIF31898.1 uncharacterized protein DUF4270 [Flavobacterium sp. 9]
MYNTSFIKKILLVATVVLLYSCDKDFNAIGEELIGDNHFDLVPEQYGVTAFSQEVTPVQSNGLPFYSLGIYNNPVFGETTGNFVSQVGLTAYKPTIGESPVIESVVLTVPYFSHATAVDPKGGNVYALDSIYGPKEGKLKLSVYESGAQMYSSYYDGNGSLLGKLYYSDQDTNTPPLAGEVNFNTKKLGVPLNDSQDKSQNDKFFFSAKQTVDSTVVDANAAIKTYTYQYSAPQMRLDLNKAFFQTKILNASAANLSSDDVFQQYFKGLYFQVEKAVDGSPSNMAFLDFLKPAGPAKITIKYKAKTAITTDGDTTEDKVITINLTGAGTSLLKDAKSSVYSNGLANRNKDTGDDRLYLKGGQGSVAVINLFDKTDLIGYDSNNVLVNKPNGVSDELDEIRHNVIVKKWLVNEANLVFYIDADKMKTAEREPKRVYLYDLDNNTIIADYVDSSTNAIDPKQSRSIFGGIIALDATTKKGVSYKVRVTKHIRNLIKDPTIKNVRLGLSVTEGIDVITSNKLRLKNDVISEAPRGSVMGPLGTILYGNNVSAADTDKKLKLLIYYTKPN